MVRKFFQAIKYSQFYKQKIKGLYVMKILIHIRNQVSNILEIMYGFVNPKKKVYNLVEYIRNRDNQLIEAFYREGILFLTNDWGGGSENYLQRACCEYCDKGKIVYIIRYSREKYEFWLLTEKEEKKFYLQSLAQLGEINEKINIDTIIINQLTLYPDPIKQLGEIQRLKALFDSKLIMLFHDYYAVCPSFTLTQKNGLFCGLKCSKECTMCYQEQEFMEETSCPNISTWRKQWKELLQDCSEVRCFSEDTLDRVKKVYGTDLKYTLVPHKVDYIPNVKKSNKTTQYLNIGVLGGLSPLKGGYVIQELVDVIRKKDWPIRVVLVGYTDGIKINCDRYFVTTGRYNVDDLPSIVKNYDIDLFFIPSIWPETFSYTTEEAIQMGMPVVTFDLGAPATRVREYSRGMVLNTDKDPNHILEKIIDFSNRGYYE